MKHTLALVYAPFLFAWAVSLHAQGDRPDGNDRLKLAVIFASAADNGGKVTIPPGDYYLDGIEPIPLRSDMTVTAYGARFHLPEKLGDQARIVLFSGERINQPRNFVLADNVFVNNTTKCERDPRRGRRSFLTGDYEEYAELYFTTHEPGGRYDNVTVRGNIFISGDHASHAITFAPGGDTLLVTDNIFQGQARTIAPTTGCSNVTIRGNVGAEPPKGKAPQ